MYEEMKSKRCIYKGIVFYSKLEARWAVVFDALGIKWKYQPRKLSREWGNEIIEYLPDFYFPDDDIYAEVKPSDDALRQKSYVLSLLVDWEGPLANGIIILGSIPDSTKMAYRIPYFSLLRHREACVLDRAIITPDGIKPFGEELEYSEGGDSIPDGTTVTPGWTACGDRRLLRTLIDAYTAGWFPKGIEELTE